VTLLALGLPAPVAAQTGTRVEYYHLDALGSVRVVTNASGQVLRRHDYRPFGEEVSPSHPSPERKLFTGQERDAETGLDYFGARYYRADIARFTTVDPELNIKEALVDPQRWNRYAYVTNNPLKYTDPDGKNPLWITGGIGAAVYGGWAIYQNVRSGAPHWYNNVGFEAAKGFVVGATLGLAAPALATADVGIGAGTMVLDAAAVGKAREVLVAELVGGRVAGDAKVTLQNVGSTGVDVFGRAGEFIGVGGPAKAGDLADFGGKLQILAGTAGQAGVKAQYYLAKGTPDAVVKLAQKWLGKENVFFFEMKQ
jgi:RHS repeat-associated protein